MNKEYFLCYKSSPVVDTLEFKSGLDESNPFAEGSFQFGTVFRQSFKKKYPVSKPSIPYLDTFLHLFYCTICGMSEEVDGGW